MNFIDHIVEPTKLLLTWRAIDERYHPRYVVAELNRVGNEVTLNYLHETKDFSNAQKEGFTGYPAFQDMNQPHSNVLDAFMRRLPPRARGDFKQYLEGLRLKPDVQLSDFALLGYSGAKLPNDGFSIIHPFSDVNGPCELLVEATGYRKIHKAEDFEINIGDTANFVREFNNDIQEEAIRIMVNGKHIGYVARTLIPAFNGWLNANRVSEAIIEKTNGTSGKPTVYLFVKVARE